MARPNSPPRPNAARPRPGSGKARPTAKRRPAPQVQKPAGFSPKATGSSGDTNEVVLSPAPKRPASKHLKMVPINEQNENTYDDGKGSASEAFSRPTPPAGPSAGAPMAAGPVMGMAPQPMGIQGPVAGPMVGGPMAAGMHMGGGPMGPMAGVPGQMPYAPLEERATSARVYMVVLGLILMVCMAIMTVAGVVLIAVVQSQVPDAPPPLEQQAVAPRVVRSDPVDSGGPPAEKPAPKRQPKRNSGGSKKPAPKPNPSPAPAAGAPPPEAAGQPGTVTVTLGGGVTATSAQVNCGNGTYRERAMFQGTKATIPNVPGGNCYLVLNGAGIKKKFSFSGAKNFQCTGAGGNFNCR